MIANERGFTLVEMLLVLAIMLTLLFVSSSIVLKAGQRESFDTYVEQFKLLNYEAYAKGREQYSLVNVRCMGNNILLQNPKNPSLERNLYWPNYVRADCSLRQGKLLQYGGRGVEATGTILIEDVESEKKVNYAVHFTYGRLRQTW